MQRLGLRVKCLLESVKPLNVILHHYESVILQKHDLVWQNYRFLEELAKRKYLSS